MFKTHADMKVFLKNENYSKKFRIDSQYTTIPVLHIYAPSNILEDLIADEFIQKIDYDYRCYLSNISIEKPTTRSKEISYRISAKNTISNTIRVALADSGIDHKLKKLKKSIVSKINITTEPWDDLAGHGTLMASVIADIFPHCQLVDVKITSRSGLVYASHVLSGLDQLFTMHIDILMLGISSPIPTDGSDILSTMCKKYVEKGALIVMPAGNFGPEPNTIGFTSQVMKSFCIGSMNSREKISFFSSRATEKPDFYVVGENVTTTSLIQGSLGRPHPTHSDLRVISGTSVAAAKFTGLLARIKQAYPEYEHKELYDYFMRLSSDSKFLSDGKFESFRPKNSTFKRTLLISSLVTLILGLFGIGSIFLFK
ncbi:MAG: hypothetical protein EU530_02910 [Promethearchaeota archaeon]|nr:MAG: hypothetical protein EU530_02910 [Candidatus Lokiarchaeota archaeon]